MIRNEEVKIFILSDDMIVCLSDPKNSMKKTVQLTSRVS